MGLKKHLERFIRGWLPKEPQAPSYKVKMAKEPTKAFKVLWYVIVFAILALMITAVIVFFIPFYAESLLNRTIVLVFRVLVLTALVVLAVYFKRRGRNDNKAQPISQFFYKKYRSRAIYMICFGLATGFMLSGLVVFLLGQPLPINYSLPLFFAFTGVGAFIGDWIGKKRNYQFPLLP